MANKQLAISQQTQTGLEWTTQFHRENISELGPIKIQAGTINLLAGASMSGKSATCLHLVDSAITKNKKIYYFDVDSKSALNRPHPNLFKEFYQKKQEEYLKFFRSSSVFNSAEILKIVENKETNLLIIDSIFHPYQQKISNPRIRAKQIKEFLISLRQKIDNASLAVIITTPILKINQNNIIVCGGDFLKYVSDIKILIQYLADSSDWLDEQGRMGKRTYFIDRQIKYLFEIDYGGNITIKEDSIKT